MQKSMACFEKTHEKRIRDNHKSFCNWNFNTGRSWIFNLNNYEDVYLEIILSQIL